MDTRSLLLSDILDPFNHTVPIEISFKNRIVINGCDLKPSLIANRPRVEVGGVDLREFYTLIMVDPDAPSPTDPSLKEYLHWMVTDIPGTTGANFGKEQVCYESPRPRFGIHRMVFLLFHQLGRETVFPPEARHHFNTRSFVRRFHLTPAATVYFNCQREAGCGGRRFI